MESTVEKIADFVVGAEFDDLPGEVVHESKRVLLDSVGCALAGLATDKGKISIKLARRFGGPAESTIIGAGDRVSCFGATFANSELIGALDYDALLFPVVHITPYVIPAPLALAESAGASGRDLILAVALAHEIATRVGAALKSTKGKTETPAVYGHSSAVFGGAVGAGRILKLDQERMSQALGIAGFNAPVPTMSKFGSSLSCGIIKYASAGWLSLEGLTAALLAEMGYTGDKTVLDGEQGFWRFSCSNRWDPEAATAKLGEEWHLRIGYKIYPCCGRQDGALDCFCKIIDKNSLTPDDIEEVRIWLDPVCCERPLWKNMEIRNEIQAQFSVAYTIAVAAHRVKRSADWQDFDTIRNPKILEFMKKVRLEPYPGLDKMALEDPAISKVEVVAKERTFVEECQYARGRAVPEGARLTDEELADKFRVNASRILPRQNIDKAVTCLLQLDKIENISELMKVVAI